MAYRILVVEDDATVTLLVRELLRSLGYEVAAVAATGSEAIRLATAEAPDLILMDISLAGSMTGIQAARWIQEQIDIPIVFATGYSDQATIESVQTAQPYGFVIKPYTRDELRVAIEIAIHKHRVDQKLRRSEQRFSMTLKAIADAVVSTRQSGEIDFYNDAAEPMTGVHSTDAIGRPVADVIRLIDSQSEQPITIEQNWNGDALLVSVSGDRMPVSASIANIASDGGPSLGQVLVLRDVRERQRIAEFLENQRVQNIIEEVSEAERRRFGQDLHDGLGQALTGATFLCKKLEEQLSGESRPEGLEAARIGDILSAAIESARDLSRGLLPVPDQPDGLAIALERLVEQIVMQFEIECDFIDASATPVSNPMVANHLFRICQEAVNNAVKHAAPRRIDIHLQTENGSGILTIGDDGKGIVGQLDRRGSGFGIMRRRAAAIGGSLKVVPNEGGGTLVICSFSLEPQ